MMRDMANTRKPWEHAKQGGSESDPLAVRFVESLSYDTRLYAHDIAGSIAHARMLREVNLIADDDLSAIERGLEEIRNEIEAADITGWSGWNVELEDVHMCIEAALIEKIGQPGRKLHTGRSRNDQVATDLLLWMRDAADDVRDDLRRLMEAFLDLAERQGDLLLPTYTHLQRAQIATVGGELMAWTEAFYRCRNRLSILEAAGEACPLGSGAVAGSTLPLDREMTTEALDFLEVTGNSIYATANRDTALDYVHALSMIAMWLSRWAEQWIIYMSSEFGFLRIGDAYTTGSSMMPQKRNPDMLELIRGRCGDLYGRLMALLTLNKGLTIGYNRDLQEDKRHVFAAHDTVRDALQMAAGIVRSAEFDSQRITAGLDRGFLDATALAEYLVTRGVPFRTAHQHVGQMVHLCETRCSVKLADLPLEAMREVCPEVGDDVYDWLGPDNVVRRYQSAGNAGLDGYREQVARWRDIFAEDDAFEAEVADAWDEFDDEPDEEFDDDPDDFDDPMDRATQGRRDV